MMHHTAVYALALAIALACIPGGASPVTGSAATSGVRIESLTRLPPRGPILAGTRAGEPDAGAEYVPGEVLVRVRGGAESKRDPLAAEGFVRVERIEGIGVARYRLAPGGDVDAAVDRLRRHRDVVWAEPNFLVYPARVPGDPFYANVDGSNTDLQRWTFGGLGANVGINAEAAWDVTVGRPDVTIAVIDSGVDFEQTDLARGIWANVGEVPGNARDDDGNGLVDDFNGWDFITGDPDPSPDLGNGRDDDSAEGPDTNVFHGTFVANCAGARGDDGQGVCGAAWDCRIMPLKVFTDDGAASTFQIAAAVRYAADNGADVINLSLSTPSAGLTMLAGVEYAAARDCVVVAAAGNGNSNALTYPAGYAGVLAVGASDHGFTSAKLLGYWNVGDLDGRAPYSEYGPLAVDVVAPGTVFTLSVASAADAAGDPDLEPGQSAGYSAAGSSFSAPIVAGLAALMISRDKDLHGGVRTLSARDVVDIIQRTARNLPDDPTDSPDAGEGWDGHGRIDFRAALDAVSAGAPPASRTLRLDWKPPAEGATLPPPAALRVASDSSMALGPTAGGPPAPTSPAPAVTGYRIYRASAPGAPLSAATLIGTTGAGQLWFVDASAPAGDVFYTVTALAGAAESGTSNEASPVPLDAGAPAVNGPVFAREKLALRAEGSRIAPGALLVVNGTRAFALSPSKSGAKWLVKKTARSQRGAKTVAQAIPAGQPVTLQIINPDGRRSDAVPFER